MSRLRTCFNLRVGLGRVVGGLPVSPLRSTEPIYILERTLSFLRGSSAPKVPEWVRKWSFSHGRPESRTDGNRIATPPTPTPSPVLYGGRCSPQISDSSAAPKRGSMVCRSVVSPLLTPTSVFIGLRYAPVTTINDVWNTERLIFFLFSRAPLKHQTCWWSRDWCLRCSVTISSLQFSQALYETKGEGRHRTSSRPYRPDITYFTAFDTYMSNSSQRTLRLGSKAPL